MKHLKNIWIVLLSIVFCITSCAAQDDDFIVDPVRPKNLDDNKKELRILVFGDSFSRDAFSYVPGVIEDLCPNLNVDMEILYLGGKSLKYHWDYLSNDKDLFTLDVYTSYAGKWNSISYTLGEEVVTAQEWDLVILQEGSIAARNYNLTQTHVNSISGYIRDRQPTAKFAFMMSPAKPDGSPALGDYSSDDVWMMYVNTSQLLLSNEEVDYIIPCGTAIQNARQTSLDKYGDFGHLSYDGNHLQEGLPCLIEAYVTAQFLFNLKESGVSIENSTLRITQGWVNEKRIPGKHGSVIEGTDEEYAICKRSAMLALEKPYEISNPLY